MHLLDRILLAGEALQLDISTVSTLSRNDYIGVTLVDAQMWNMLINDASNTPSVVPMGSSKRSFISFDAWSAKSYRYM